jgi:hypothetical protein
VITAAIQERAIEKSADSRVKKTKKIGRRSPSNVGKGIDNLIGTGRTRPDSVT